MKRNVIHIAALALPLAFGPAATAQDAKTNASPAAAADSAAPRMNLQAFQIIENRNIFDPNRRPPRVDTGPRAPRVNIEYFGLSATITYGNQAYALFDGSGPVRNRGFKPSEKINGYTIAAITNNSVRLQGGSNEVVNLVPGMQMRRENNGPWKLVPGVVASSDSGVSPATGDAAGDGGSSSASAPSGPEADVIARLMKKRADELKDPKDQPTGSTGEGTGTNEIH